MSPFFHPALTRLRAGLSGMGERPSCLPRLSKHSFSSPETSWPLVQ